MGVHPSCGVRRCEDFGGSIPGTSTLGDLILLAQRWLSSRGKVRCCCCCCCCSWFNVFDLLICFSLLWWWKGTQYYWYHWPCCCCSPQCVQPILSPLAGRGSDEVEKEVRPIDDRDLLRPCWRGGRIVFSHPNGHPKGPKLIIFNLRL